MVTRVCYVSRSAQSVCLEIDMFLLLPIRSRSFIRWTAGSFLNKRENWIQMLNGEKTIETRLKDKYTHVIVRMVKRIRKAGVKDHVIARLGGRMGRFSSARAAVEAAAQVGRKLGVTGDELFQYMTR